MRLLGLDHVQLAIPPGGLETARAFYAGVLGLVEVERPPTLSREGAWFRGGGFEVHVGAEEPFRPARRAHPAFRVEGLAALRARLAAAGSEVREAEDVPGRARFHASDPFGNRLEFVELEG